MWPPPPPLPKDALCDAKRLLRALGSMWLIVFARGLMLDVPAAAIPPVTLLAIEFLRTLPETVGGIPVVLSLRPLRGLVDVAPCWCSFCWCRNSRSRRAKHLVHCGHSNGFSFVCDLSCRFRCSSLANDRLHVPQTCGLGLSVFGGGKRAAVVCGGSGLAVWTEATFGAYSQS